MKKNSPTMKDVAKLAGVSQPTVSYVINNSASISEEVKNRVNSAIKELNYQPNYFAKVLKTNNSRIIAIVIPDIINQFYSRILHSIEEQLRKADYQVTIYSTSYDSAIEEASVRQMLAYNVYGVIVLYQFTSEDCWKMLSASGKVVVAIEGGSACSSYNIPCINVDSHLGGYMATRYLLSAGRKRIAYIHQNAPAEALQERCDGYKHAMQEVGLFRSGDIFMTDSPDNKWIEGQKLGRRLTQLPFDGIITSSDLIAVGIIRELLTIGKRIPDDVSVIGYDDVPIAELFVPSLTTIAQPVEEMCSMAVELILTPSDKPRGIIPTLQPKLVKRDSA